jgi:uncharacterized membrane protein YhaH (DUF805 family)
MKKYFEFSGTINGTNYFLRNLLATLLAYIGGFAIGFGLGSEKLFLFGIGLIVIAPTLWFSVCTIFKRSLALFPLQASIITIGLILFQVLGMVNEIFSLVPFIMGLILIFKNSNIESHEG